MRDSPLRFRTFRIVFEIASSINGVNIEIRNPAGSGKVLRFAKIKTYCSSSATLTLNRTNSNSTGGTSADYTPVKMDTAQPDPAFTVKTYTVAPTMGGLDGVLDYLQMGTTMFYDQTVERDRHAPLIPAGYNLAVQSGISLAYKGYIELEELDA